MPLQIWAPRLHSGPLVIHVFAHSWDSSDLWVMPQMSWMYLKLIMNLTFTRRWNGSFFSCWRSLITAESCVGMCIVTFNILDNTTCASCVWYTSLVMGPRGSLSPSPACLKADEGHTAVALYHLIAPCCGAHFLSFPLKLFRLLVYQRRDLSVGCYHVGGISSLTSMAPDTNAAVKRIDGCCVVLSEWWCGDRCCVIRVRLWFYLQDNVHCFTRLWCVYRHIRYFQRVIEDKSTFRWQLNKKKCLLCCL